jgi:FdhE protein
MNQDQWLATHPYLRHIAELHAAVEAAISGISIPTFAVPNFENYARDYGAGIPLFESDAIELHLEYAENMLIALTTRLASVPLPGNLADECRSLAVQLRREGSLAPARPLGEDSISPRSQGLLRFLTWTIVEMHLRPALRAFENWRNQDLWVRAYCPTCGSLPVMAHLVAVDEARARYLHCGCCRTRWLYRRHGCPFCGKEDERQLQSLWLEQENGLRIDCCQECGGYLKTYTGGNPEVLLSDWTSIHLDVLAGDRGLKRWAASLYEI